MRVLNATLSIDDAADPIGIAITIEVDGQPPTVSASVAPENLYGVIEALSDATGVDLAAELTPRLRPVVDRLRDDVTRATEAQERRQQALQRWQETPAGSQ